MNKIKVLISIILIEVIIIASMGWLLLDNKDNTPPEITSDEIVYTPPEKIELEITLDEFRYSSSDPIIVNVSLTNLRSSPSNVTELNLSYALLFYLVFPDDSLIVAHDEHKGPGMPVIMPKYWILKQNETRYLEFNLKDLDFNEPGVDFRYSDVQLNDTGTYYMWVRYDGDIPNLTYSNVVDFYIED